MDPITAGINFVKLKQEALKALAQTIHGNQASNISDASNILNNEHLNPNDKDGAGYGWLLWIISFNNEELLMKTLGKGQEWLDLYPNNTALVNSKDNNGATALLCAVKYNFQEIAKCLIQNGANPLLSAFIKQSVILNQNGISVPDIREYKITPLEIASQNLRLDIIKCLLNPENYPQNGENTVRQIINIKGLGGRTPFMQLCNKAEEEQKNSNQLEKTSKIKMCLEIAKIFIRNELLNYEPLDNSNYSNFSWALSLRDNHQDNIKTLNTLFINMFNYAQKNLKVLKVADNTGHTSAMWAEVYGNQGFGGMYEIKDMLNKETAVLVGDIAG